MFLQNSAILVRTYTVTRSLWLMLSTHLARRLDTLRIKRQVYAKLCAGTLPVLPLYHLATSTLSIRAIA